MEHSMDAFEKAFERQRAAFEALMEEAPPSSPNSKLQNEMDDKLFIMERLLTHIEEEEVCTKASSIWPSPIKELSNDVHEKEDDAKEQEGDAQEHETDAQEHETDAQEHETDGQKRESDAKEEESDVHEQESDIQEQESDVQEQKRDAQEQESDLQEQESDIQEKEVVIRVTKKEAIQQGLDNNSGDDSIIILETVEKSENPLVSRADLSAVTPVKKTIIKPTMLPNSEIRVHSLQPPQHKIFHKAQPFTNKTRMLNALQYAVFPGQVNNAKLCKAKKEIGAATAKHFLVLFRDDRCQFRGLYTWDQKSSVVHKLSGVGPAQCSTEDIKVLFKYNSGGKRFDKIEVKHFANVVDGFAIEESFWMKPKTIQGAPGTS